MHPQWLTVDLFITAISGVFLIGMFIGMLLENRRNFPIIPKEEQQKS